MTTEELILNLIDIAADSQRPANEIGSTEEMGLVITQLERIAAGLGALALIHVSENEEIREAWGRWNAWERY